MTNHIFMKLQDLGLDFIELQRDISWHRPDCLVTALRAHRSLFELALALAHGDTYYDEFRKVAAPAIKEIDARIASAEPAARVEGS